MMQRRGFLKAVAAACLSGPLALITAHKHLATTAMVGVDEVEWMLCQGWTIAHKTLDGRYLVQLQFMGDIHGNTYLPKAE
jgi:hypothetical protein